MTNEGKEVEINIDRDNNVTFNLVKGFSPMAEAEDIAKLLKDGTMVKKAHKPHSHKAVNTQTTVFV